MPEAGERVPLRVYWVYVKEGGRWRLLGEFHDKKSAIEAAQREGREGYAVYEEPSARMVDFKVFR